MPDPNLPGVLANGGPDEPTDAGGLNLAQAIDIDIHDQRCSARMGSTAWRFNRCPKCGRTVDTFGGNVE